MDEHLVEEDSSHCNRQSVHLEKAKGHLEVVLGV